MSRRVARPGDPPGRHPEPITAGHPGLHDARRLAGLARFGPPIPPRGARAPCYRGRVAKHGEPAAGGREPTMRTGPLGSTIHVLRADAGTVAELAAVDWNRWFRHVCLDPVRGIVTLTTPRASTACANCGGRTGAAPP